MDDTDELVDKTKRRLLSLLSREHTLRIQMEATGHEYVRDAELQMHLDLIEEMVRTLQHPEVYRDGEEET